MLLSLALIIAVSGMRMEGFVEWGHWQINFINYIVKLSLLGMPQLRNRAATYGINVSETCSE